MHVTLRALFAAAGVIIGTAGSGFGAGPSASAHGVQNAASAHRGASAVAIWQRLSLRAKLGAPALIAAISPSPRQLTLWVSAYSDSGNGPHISRITWNFASHALGQPQSAASPPPAAFSAYRLIAPDFNRSQPVLLHGRFKASVVWPASVPTYLSGINPATTPFSLDNRVIGQSGQWLWVALKGPAHNPSALPSTWGFRYWNRLVVLNIHSGRYRIFSLPRSDSEALADPLWYAPPAFAASHNRVYIGIGPWLGTFPANPADVTAVAVHGGTPSPLMQARRHRALSILATSSWQSVDAEAAFWNCYVMKDPSPQACTPGAQYPDGAALSQQFTYYNHGSVPAALQWASQLPLPAAENRLRGADIMRLKASLRASLLMTWTALGGSAKALRQAYPQGPPYPLPGYYRHDGLYWAKRP